MAGGMEEVDLSTLKVKSRCHIKPQVSKMHIFIIFAEVFNHKAFHDWPFVKHYILVYAYKIGKQIFKMCCNLTVSKVTTFIKRHP